MGLFISSGRIIKESFTISFQGKDVETLQVNPGQRGDILNICEYSSGSVVFTHDGSTPDDTNSPRISDTSANFNPIVNIDLSQFQIKGTSTGSKYFVTYGIYQ